MKESDSGQLHVSNAMAMLWQQVKYVIGVNGICKKYLGSEHAWSRPCWKSVDAC